MTANKVTPDSLKVVLERLIEIAEQDTSFAEQITFQLNRFFDDLLNDDFFGTEGQLDPRGDHRN